MEFFKGRELVIATMHKKERVIAPIMESELGVSCKVISDFDTDQFGMFTGEIERKTSPLDSLRLKCEAAINQTKCDLVVASEGSFGQHPSFFFVPADEEFVMLLDKKQNLEIIGRALSTETNFGGKQIQSVNELEDFLQMINFPEHAVIMRFLKDGNEIIKKGLNNKTDFLSLFKQFCITGHEVHIETDMRALFNPTRMKVIEQATKDLVGRITSVCPECRYPGYSVVQHISGLPCELCNSPTNSTLYNIYECKKCNFHQSIQFPKGKTTESAIFCDRCNP
jgi:hypothetical protein